MSCEKHKKVVEKYNGSLEELANDIGDLHYGALTQLLYLLSKKIEDDGEKDYKGGRVKLAAALQYTSMSLFESALRMEKAWKISKPFMK